MPATGYAQVGSVPLQPPPQSVPSLMHLGRLPSGGFATTMQVPAEPATLHATHGSAHAVEQHTPSAQKPLAQSAAAAQDAPIGSAWSWSPKSRACTRRLPSGWWRMYATNALLPPGELTAGLSSVAGSAAISMPSGSRTVPPPSMRAP
jgi:hypothetical protein